MTSMQIEVKAASDQQDAGAETLTLESDFTSPAGFGEPVRDTNGLYGVTFDGSIDNNDGTMTLRFTIYVTNKYGLSHVSFGLPEGQTALNMESTYTTEQCTAP